MKLVKAESKDLSKIADLVNVAYRGDYAKNGWTTESDFLDGQRTDPESLADMLKDPMTSLYMAFHGDELVGSVVLKKEEHDVLYFGMLAVEPLKQALGIGKMMMGEIENFARENGFKELRLTVIDLRSELIAYYERRGFQATGEWEPFPENDPKFGIPKTKLRLMIYKKKI